MRLKRLEEAKLKVHGVQLAQEQLAYLERSALRRQTYSISAEVRALVQEALEREREREQAEPRKVASA